MEQENSVVVYPGTCSLQNMTVRELTDLRVLIMKYDEYVKRLIREKNR